jgi:threonine dehydrogenase-like Zn-dependent dehydrogenase
VEPAVLQGDQLGGSNAFGVEEVEGVRRHGIELYLDLAACGRVDLAPLVAHTSGLSAWRDAFAALADQAHTGAVKVALDPTR